MNHKKQDRTSYQSQLHFKQWSNRSYAVFCSLGKVVHIGNLAISLTQWIGELIEHVKEELNLALNVEEDEAAEELLEQELLQAIPVVNAEQVCGINILYRLENINYR